MGGTLGSGQVSYHEDRPIIHFASSPDQIEAALRNQKLRENGFETTKRVPS